MPDTFQASFFMRINWPYWTLLTLIVAATTWNNRFLWGASLVGVVFYFSYLNVINRESDEVIISELDKKVSVERATKIERAIKQVYDHSKVTDKRLKDANEKLASVDTRLHQRSKDQRGVAQRGNWQRAFPAPQVKGPTERTPVEKSAPKEKNRGNDSRPQAPKPSV